MNLKNFFNLSSGDLNKYYSETYMNLQYSGKSGFCYILDFPDSGKNIRFESADGDLVERELASINYDFSFPQLGYYNFDDSSVILAQRPFKQWKKAISSSSFVISSFNEQVEKILRMDYINPSFVWGTNQINSLFGSQKTNVLNAIQLVFKEEVFCRAVSKDFCISVGISSVFPQLWFMERLIGTFLTKDTIKITNPLFKEEAKDFFSPYQIEIK